MERGGPQRKGLEEEKAALGAETSLSQSKTSVEIRHKGVCSLTPQSKQLWPRTRASKSKDQSCKAVLPVPYMTPHPVPPILTVVRFGVDGVDPQVLPEKRN